MTCECASSMIKCNNHGCWCTMCGEMKNPIIAERRADVREHRWSEGRDIPDPWSSRPRSISPTYRVCLRCGHSNHYAGARPCLGQPTREEAMILLGDVVRAWESLPEGGQSVGDTNRWLLQQMAPAINNIRDAVGEN